MFKNVELNFLVNQNTINVVSRFNSFNDMFGKHPRFWVLTLICKSIPIIPLTK